jgi:hypothetical protein
VPQQVVVGMPYPLAPHPAAHVVRRVAALPPATPPLLVLPLDLRAAASDIPRVPLAAYARAARAADSRHPGCQLSWQLVAAIGFIESGHARSGGSRAPHWNGIARPAILGPVLDGSPGIGAISDTDQGRLDGNTRWDRAVGPMQFIPSSWSRYAADGDRDGTRNPQSVWDAAAATADYLCTAASSLDAPANQVTAVFAYNHSFDYVRAVLTVAASYLGVDPALLGVDALPHDAAPSPTAQQATPVPGVLATAAPRPVVRPTPTASRSPSPTPTPTAATSPTATPTATPSGTPTPTSSPAGS